MFELIVGLALAVGIGASSVMILVWTIGVDDERGESPDGAERGRGRSDVEAVRAETDRRHGPLTERERTIVVLTVLVLLLAVLAIVVAGFGLFTPGPPYPS